MANQTLPQTLSDKLLATVVKVTPHIANHILKRQNNHNRNLRPRAVADYARDMAAGNWTPNGEGIKFDRNGTLLDGQHRLTALIEADVDVPMLFITGLDPKAQETMDTGRPRTPSDVFALRGEARTVVLAAVLRRVWMWDQGNHKFFASQAPTRPELAALLEAHPEIRRSAEISGYVYQTYRSLPQSIIGTAHHVFSRIDGDAAVWFFTRLGDGAELPLGHPVLTLRNRASADRKEGKRMPEPRAMAYLVHAWNAVREGRSLTRITIPVEAPMPMPR
ncbi:hypothetical protein [Embleya sp. NPDC005971]|uniref:hypothetical protein n=1 Tax=Embleya sp. NPDC005971 TaxID=3156724 RepID=UPI0033DA6759